ncbi:hypothetical protein AAIH67_31825, partial [Pseudomonas aeruginosa]
IGKPPPTDLAKVVRSGTMPSAAGYTPLDNFTGVANNLDHIMATSPPHTAFNFSEDYSTATASTHDILCARMNW